MRCKASSDETPLGEGLASAGDASVNLALRRRATDGPDEQVVERCPLRGAQGAEQIVLDEAEPAVGQTELVLAAG